MNLKRLRAFIAANAENVMVDKSEADLRAAADRYASCLVPGDRIIEETDGEEIARFRHLLPAALIARGMAAEPCAGGFVIATVARSWVPRHVEWECPECHWDWWRCCHANCIDLVPAGHWRGYTPWTGAKVEA